MRRVLWILGGLAAFAGLNYLIVALLPAGAEGIFLFVEALLGMILIHEAGHFSFAKLFGIKVEEFFVGFGPRLWSFRRGETEYGIKALPLGGYVRIAGMNPLEEPAPEDRARTFGAKPPWQRAIVLGAGSASHFLLAVIFLAIFFMAVGLPVYGGPPLVGRVEATLGGEPSPAAEAGLKAGDRILEVDGMEIGDSDELIAYTRDHVGEEIELLVERDGERFTITVTPVLSEIDGVEAGRLGILLSEEIIARERSNPFVAVGKAARTTVTMTRLSFVALGQAFSPSGLARIGRQVIGDEDRGLRDPAGIVGAGRLAGQAASSGNLGTLLLLLAGLNVFVGIFNILPLPPLDGGHLAVVVWEKLTGRKVDMRKLLPITAVVAGLLILLTLSLTYLDFVDPIPDPFR